MLDIMRALRVGQNEGTSCWKCSGIPGGIREHTHMHYTLAHMPHMPDTFAHAN